MPKIGVPIKILHEADGQTLTVELMNGFILRGVLHNCDDQMNIQLSVVTITTREGSIKKCEHIYVRGSQIRMIILPDMLRNAPLFARFDPKNPLSKAQIGTGMGRGGAYMTRPSTTTSAMNTSQD